MNLLLFLNAYEEDGPGLLMARIASKLQKHRDLRISTAALSRGGPLMKQFENMDIPTHIVGMMGVFDWKRYRALVRFIKSGNFDIVHTNILRADLFGRMAAHAARVPVIVSTEHGIHSWEYRGNFIRHLVRRIYLHTLSYTSKIIAVSDFVKKDLIHEGVPEQKIVRIFNGVDVDSFVPVPPEERDKWRAYITDKPVKRTIGLVGNLIEMKGLRYFIRALPLILEKHPDTLVVVVGEGMLRNEMEAEVNRQGFSSRVKFLGRITELTRRIMASLDILVQPSLTESFGLTVAEALSCEVPVVATKVGGLPDIIEDGVCGFLIPPKNPEALAARVNQLLEDPGIIRSMGQAGRRRIMDRFSLSDTAQSYLELYRDLT